MNSKDDFITLPLRIDFRKPGQLSPWEAKEQRDIQSSPSYQRFALWMQNAMRNAHPLNQALSSCWQYARPQDEWLRRGGFL